MFVNKFYLFCKYYYDIYKIYIKFAMYNIVKAQQEL